MKYQGDKTDVAALIAYAQSLEAENERLRALLRDALDGLHNDFEPDNQSTRYKRIKAALDDAQK